MLRRRAPFLVPAYDHQYKAYHLIDHVQDAIASFPGHSFNGRLDCEGEDAGDLWRVVVRDGQVARVEPRIVWPDEEGEA